MNIEYTGYPQEWADGKLARFQDKQLGTGVPAHYNEEQKKAWRAGWLSTIGGNDLNGTERLSMALATLGVSHDTPDHLVYNLLNDIEVIAALAAPPDGELEQAVSDMQERLMNEIQQAQAAANLPDET